MSKCNFQVYKTTEGFYLSNDKIALELEPIKKLDINAIHKSMMADFENKIDQFFKIFKNRQIQTESKICSNLINNLNMFKTISFNHQFIEIDIFDNSIMKEKQEKIVLYNKNGK